MAFISNDEKGSGRMPEVERWRLLATGMVQGVGYRARVADAARARHLVGTVENDPEDPGQVHIVVQGRPAVLEMFRQAISFPRGLSRPDEVIIVETLPPDPGLKDFRLRLV
jgi:acylphosphatase